jgi:prefoldin subunit 5
MVLTLALPVSVRAQYYSINVDYKTMAAMSEAYATEAAMEALHNENLQKIYDSYKAAEVASAGIFSSKYLDRKALTNLNLWNDKDENYYYKRIYNIVSKRIIPKMITCAELMIEDPSTAIYWGSYLLKTMEDVKSLCQQFESVVTNSTLSFKDIAFLEITDQFKQIFNITNLGSVDWKELFDHLGDDIKGTFTKDNLEHDLDQLIEKGVGLASAGYSNGVGQLMQGTDFGGTFMDKMGSVITLASNAAAVYDEYKDLSASDILTSVIGQDNINSLFNLSDYNLTKWLDDYSESAQGRYYTQRVYIYRRDYGSEQVCSYEPPTDNDNVINGSHWYRISTTDPDFWPSSAQTEAILANSESHAGWSRDKVNQLNSSGDKYHYYMNYYRSAYIISRGGKQHSKAYAYSIYVTKSWDVKEEVYEAVFDSYSMDWNTFMAQMNARLQQYNANGDHEEITNEEELQNYINTHPEESNYTYYIGYDSKNYYTATDAKKMAGSSSATFSVTCHDGGSLGKGTTTYKCSHCGGSPGSHTKECSMYTSLSGESGVQTGELSSELTRLQSQAASLQGKIDALTAENTELLRKMSNATSSADYESYRSQYNANKSKISELQRQLDETNQSIKDTQQALDEAKEGEKAQTDDYTRIPQLMKAMKDAYGITWTDNGSWSGYTFIRQGTVGSVKGTVTFKATVSIARKPKYFLGIKIHRAIVQIDWELTSSWSDTSVVEVLNLDPSNSDEENSRIVNQKMSELAKAYPKCEVNVELNQTPSMETEDTDGVHHLLWASDRLEIARGIEARLAKIYTDLVMVEKFLHYRHTLKDWATDLLPKLNADQGRKMTIAERCRRRWLHNGGSLYYEAEEEDDRYEDE